MRRIFVRVSLATLILAVITSCDSRTEYRYFVAFSQANNAEPYRTAQNGLLQKRFAQYPDVHLVITDAQQDSNKQIAQIETFIRQKPSLLIVAANERAPLTKVMAKAVAAGIPVIALERDIAVPNYTTFIGVDNRAIGRLAGEFIRDELSRRNGEAKGKLVEIRGLLDDGGEVARHEGALGVFNVNPGIEVVREAVADWSQSKAHQKMLRSYVLSRRSMPCTHIVMQWR